MTGPAEKAGLQPGDVVLALDGKAVKNPEQLKALAEKAKGQVALLVQRGDAQLFVPLDLG